MNDTKILFRNIFIEMSQEIDAEIYHEIGRGREHPNYQTTVVYKARLKRSIEFVVAKCVDAQRKDQYSNAVQLTRKLNHENIVHFYNWYQAETHLYIILEYCPGGNLKDLLEKDVCLPESIIRIFATDILDALLYLHSHGILYRDFSPRNIFLDESGILKLSDFTRSIRLGEIPDNSDVDLDMLQYIAPELLSQEGVPSFSSDHYGLACLMYQMATGMSPFASENQETLISNILNVPSPRIDNMSSSFNDLMSKLLVKNPYERLTWSELLKHPFWQDAFTDRLDKYLANFNPEQLPKQELFEKSRSSFSTASNSARSSILNLSLHDSQFILKDIQLPKSQTKSSENDIIEDDFEDDEEDIDEDAQIEAKVQEEKIKEPPIKNYLLQSPLLKPAPVAANNTIETFPLAPYEGALMPVTPSLLQSNIPEDIERVLFKIRSHFEGPDRAKTKVPFISFLIQNARKPEVAMNFSNQSFLSDLFHYSITTKHPTIKAGILLLIGTIIRYMPLSVENIDFSFLGGQEFADMVSFPQEIVSRKAISLIGEIATFCLNRGNIIPSFVLPFVLKSMRAADEAVRHYAVRSLANILFYLNPINGNDCSSKNHIDLSVIERSLFDFNFGQGTVLIETFATAVASLYSFHKTTSIDFACSLSKNLLSRPSPNAQTLGIIIAAETDSLLSVKDEIVKAFKNGSGELNTKAMLAICLIFRNHMNDFREISQKFFSSLEKMENSDNSALFGVLMDWTILFISEVVEEESRTNKNELLEIIVSAAQIKCICIKMFSNKFAKKMRKVIRSNTFSMPKSELAVEVFSCAIGFEACDAAVIEDLSRPLNSRIPAVRFAVMKVLSDSAVKFGVFKNPHIKKFVESNVIPQTSSLFFDEPMIVEQTLKIISFSLTAATQPILKENEDWIKEIAGKISKQNIVSCIFSKVGESNAALHIANCLLKSDSITMDILINSKLCQAVIVSMERKDRYTKALEFLESSLTVVEKYQNSKKNVAKQFHELATLSAKCASLILEEPIAAECLIKMIKIYNPLQRQTDILVASAFSPLSITLERGCTKSEYAEMLTKIVKVIQWSAENSQAMRLRIRGSGDLLKALKKACDYGVEPLRTAAIATQKVIKG